MDNKLQLKCLVLGSAGAGKTSLLRRYHYGTFESHHPRGNNDCDTTNHWSSGKRNPTSTLGADYYIKKIPNPLLVKDRAANTQNEESPSSCIASAAAESQSQLFVQSWDTAGKERLMPQRYPAQYDKKSNFYQFLSIRLSPNTSNNNSSNYEHRYNNWTGTTTTNNNETIMDRHRDNEERKGKEVRHSSNTQHKYGWPLHYHRHNSKKKYSNEPREDALYRNVDACSKCLIIYMLLFV
jgi:GTPase SAR1 family protein